MAFRFILLNLTTMRNTFLFLFIISFQKLVAQDIHFSQYYEAPMLLNPASTGVIPNGNYRISSNHKQQWSSISAPFKTTVVSGDIHFSKKKISGLGAGLLFFNDQAGSNKISNTTAGITIAYNVQLNDNNFLSGGLSGVYAQRSINFSNAEFGSQFNGTGFDPSLSSGEILPATDRAVYMDLGAGLLWSLYSSDEFGAEAGISLDHLNSPAINFQSSAKETLFRKNTVFAGLDFKLKSSKKSILPKIYYTSQGPNKEVITGLLIRNEIGLTSRYTGANKASLLYFGGMYRWGDAAMVLLKYEFKGKIWLGISYDINTSKLSTASSGRGGLEFSFGVRGFFGGEETKVELK